MSKYKTSFNTMSVKTENYFCTVNNQNIKNNCKTYNRIIIK